MTIRDEIDRGISGKLLVNNLQGAVEWLDGFEAALRYFSGNVDDDLLTMIRSVVSIREEVD